MSSSPPAVDREIINTSFRDWQQEQTLLNAQLAESVAALDAYQSHLDGWQQELAHEREELKGQREALDRDRAAAGDAAQQIQQFSRQLKEMQTKNSNLTDKLLARTEELRELECQRDAANRELAHARESVLTASLAAQQNDSSRASEPTRAAATKAEPRRSASPVLGSVMEQFGKLREQRSLNRLNGKPR